MFSDPVSYTHLDVYKRQVQTVSLTINMKVQLGGDADIQECSTDVYKRQEYLY